MTVTAYAAAEAAAPLTPFEYDAEPIGALEVDVDVTHCGVCHTDVVMIDDEWGFSRFPVVAGHEAVGVVSAIGSAVDPQQLSVGQRVGIGAIAGTCMRCELCLSGRNQLCVNRDDTVLRGHRGGFASSVRASDWRFAYPIPDAIESHHAGPMLCAGATVFAPFLRHGVRPVDRVGIVGIGGLGHLALQFAAAWGCEVTAITSSADKRDEALRLGAHHVIVTRDTNELAAAAGTFDFLMSTVSANLPWDEYLEALKPQGVLSVVGLPEGALDIGPLALLMGERMISGGVPASRQETVQMLDFAARKGIRPRVETYSAADINDAIVRVRGGQARYRAVVEF